MDHFCCCAFPGTGCHFWDGPSLCHRNKSTRSGWVGAEKWENVFQERKLWLSWWGGQKCVLVMHNCFGHLGDLGDLGEVMRKPRNIIKLGRFMVWNLEQQMEHPFPNRLSRKRRIFGMGVEKGFHYLWYTEAVVCWKHNLFSSNTALAENGYELHKDRKLVGCVSICKKVFWIWVFQSKFGFGWVIVWFLCAFVWSFGFNGSVILSLSIWYSCKCASKALFCSILVSLGGCSSLWVWKV